MAIIPPDGRAGTNGNPFVGRARMSPPKCRTLSDASEAQAGKARPAARGVWRTAWRKLVQEAVKRAGELAARAAEEAGMKPEDARAKAEQAFRGYRFHDLRHQCITELAEGGASDHTLMALAGHLSRRMMEHYSHVRMAAKREAIDKLAAGLIAPAAEEAKPASEAVNGLVTSQTTSQRAIGNDGPSHIRVKFLVGAAWIEQATFCL